MIFPNEKLSWTDIKNSPFSCDCGTNCGNHSLIVTDKGLRMVTRKQYFRALGIPELNDVTAQVFLADSEAKFKPLQEVA